MIAIRDAIEQFRTAIRNAGLEPPHVIEPGKLHRFPGVGKRTGNTAGWCKLFDGGLGGSFGDWASGFSENWQAKREKPFSTVEREAFKRHVAEAQAQAEAERSAGQDETAAKAAAIWQAAAPAADDHPYLVSKSVKAHGLRLQDGALVVPMRDGAELHSLQFIDADGDKRFLFGGRVSGCYFPIGKPDGALCVAEGFATGASIHEVMGCAVAVAFTAGNLLPVARALRAKYPEVRLIVCADDDANTPSNPGLSKAREAAQAVGGLLAVPNFGANRPDGATDFNDLHRNKGPEAVRACIAQAAPVESGSDATATLATSATDWAEPQSLDREAAQSEPYPLDALPGAVGAAVREYQAYGQQPVALVASSALAVVSLAAQGLSSFNFDAGIDARDRGIERVEASNQEFVAWARQFAIAFARKYGEVHIDDVRRAALDAGMYPKSPGAWGTIFAGKIWRKTGEYRRSTYVSNHGHASPVWNWVG